jgi:hypothetical protein
VVLTLEVGPSTVRVVFTEVMMIKSNNEITVDRKKKICPTFSAALYSY